MRDKEIIDAVRKQIDLLCKLHVNGDTVSLKAIKNASLNPNIKPIIQSIVWIDEARKGFVVTDDRCLDENDIEVVPKGLIKAAYVTDFSDAEITAWQNYLITHNIQQPFEQIWEPVVKCEKKLSDRYEGLTISKAERNDLKKRLKIRGINMKAGEMERTFNPYQNKYEFSNENDIFIGSSIKIHYTTNSDGTITMGKLKTVDNNAHETNSVLYELDRIKMITAIKRDDVNTVGEYIADGFTAAQVFDFITIALKNAAPMCSAALLEYRNNHFSYIDIDQEFLLD